MKCVRRPIKFIKLLILTLLIVPAVYAEDVRLIGQLTYKLQQDPTNVKIAKKQQPKIIQLMQVELSEVKKNRILQRANDSLLPKKNVLLRAQPQADVQPSKILLGMNKVPVLDQGMHGTCATFSVTAALDAAMAKGDYISQVCNLQLGSYLELHGSSHSGWNGTTTEEVVNQISQYGVLNKQTQQREGCGGYTEYPAFTDYSLNSFMEPEQFSRFSEPVFGNKLSWSDIDTNNESEVVLERVKKSLQAGDRLVISVLLPRVDLGFAGAVGQNKTINGNDTWVLTTEVIRGLFRVDIAAHAMIITGYDDNAVAVDDKGRQHKGLFTLRNSWGAKYGNAGDFYMSYEYLTALGFDLKRFSSQSSI